MSEMDDYAVFEKQDLCIQDEAPYCSNSCPLGVDARGMIRQIAAGKLEAAYSEYRKKVIFAQIISRICPAPCQDSCLRGKFGDSIQIRKLEQACAENGGGKAPAKMFIPSKNAVAHIIGGSLAGISCANTLARKGFSVHIYEKSNRLGGCLRDYPAQQLPPEIIESDIAQNLDFSQIQLHLETEVTDLAQFAFGDSVFVACAEGALADPATALQALEAAASQNKLSGDADAESAQSVSDNAMEQHYLYDDSLYDDPDSSEDNANGTADIFFLLNYLEAGRSPLSEVLAGKQAAMHIEQTFKGEPLSPWPTAAPTRLIVPNPDGEHNREAVVSALGTSYSKEEAVAEAARCFQCQCLGCIDYCLLLKNNQSYPRVYINHAQQSLRTINHIHSKIAARRTNACNLCGLCGEICPNGLDMGEIYLKSRRIMHADNQLPEAFHEFWLRDMAFARSDEASLCRNQPGHNKTAYMFFPGCQMGGSRPEYVSDVYRHLCETLSGGVALCVDCCGAPSEWSGYTELTQPVIEDFRKKWEALGCPKVILACPSCEKMFRTYHADIPTASLWNVLAENQLPRAAVVNSDEDKVADGSKPLDVAVFDPCSSRYHPEEQQSIRKMLTALGYAFEELPLHGRHAQCCGYGGLIYASNPELAEEIRSDRISDSELPYVTYCVNCREVFASGGKKVWHILDLLFGNAEQAGQKAPDWATRRARRRMLKQKLLQEFWMEDFKITPPPYAGVKLIIADELSGKMERDLITTDDIKAVIHNAEQSGAKLAYDNGRFLAHLKVHYCTYWAEYEPTEQGFVLHNAYSHRMALKED